MQKLSVNSRTKNIYFVIKLGTKLYDVKVWDKK